MRIIATEADIRAGVKALRRKCATMRLVHDTAGDPPLRRRPAGFEGLARVVVQGRAVAGCELGRQAVSLDLDADACHVHGRRRGSR